MDTLDRKTADFKKFPVFTQHDKKGLSQGGGTSL